MKPRKPIARGGRPRWRNPGRQKAEFVRCFHSKERQAWVQDGPCLSCGRWPSVNAHIHKAEGSGAHRRGNFNQIVRLCDQHHHDYDEYKLEIPNARAAAAKLEAAWQARGEAEVAF